MEHCTFRPEDQSRPQPNTAFEVIGAQAANAQARMKMRRSETIPDAIDYLSDLASASFW
jgi:hypothetical protein